MKKPVYSCSVSDAAGSMIFLGIAWAYSRRAGIVKNYCNSDEGFLLCQTPTSTVGMKVEVCRVKNNIFFVFFHIYFN